MSCLGVHHSTHAAVPDLPGRAGVPGPGRFRPVWHFSNGRSLLWSSRWVCGGPYGTYIMMRGSPSHTGITPPSSVSCFHTELLGLPVSSCSHKLIQSKGTSGAGGSRSDRSGSISSKTPAIASHPVFTPAPVQCGRSLSGARLVHCPRQGRSARVATLAQEGPAPAPPKES